MRYTHIDIEMKRREADKALDGSGLSEAEKEAFRRIFAGESHRDESEAQQS